jgi:hypothetical protein
VAYLNARYGRACLRHSRIPLHLNTPLGNLTANLTRIGIVPLKVSTIYTYHTQITSVLKFSALRLSSIQSDNLPVRVGSETI